MKIVITGGSRGIGKMLVEHLHREHSIVVLGRQQDTVEGIAEEFPVEGFVCDVSDYEEVKDTFSEIGEIDALINCAGILGPQGQLLDNDIAEWQRAIEINLFGTVNTCKAALGHLKDGKGKIINFSGGGSAFPRLERSAYATSKAAVVRFTENIALDLEKTGRSVDINVIAPGAHKTDMYEEDVSEEDVATADPQQLFDLIDFLLSSKSDGVTGRFIHIKDKYNDFNKEDKDMFTLRRVDDFMFTKLEKK